MWWLRTSGGIRQVAAGLDALNGEVFEAIAESQSPLLDKTMPALSRAVDHAKLWMAIAAALGMSGSRSLRRGAGRGVVSLATTSLITRQPARVWRRRNSTPYSVPSGHSASAAAFAVGVGLENPTLGLLLGVVAGLVGFSRVVTGTHYPGDVLAGFAIGATVSAAGGRLVPPIVDTAVSKVEPLRVETPPRPDGAGLVLVINPAAGSGTGARVTAEIRRELPKAEIVEWTRHDDLQQVLRAAAERAEVLGIGGGDGTVACAATVAVQTGRPLAVFPAGTFNHFAKDIGCNPVARTIQAIREGSVSCVDLLSFQSVDDTRMVVNTASIGAYPNFVQIRERLEHKIGKPLAAAYAMLQVLRRGERVRIRYDNNTIQTSLFFLGNSTYQPSGFAPAYRTRVDDGLIDVRILETGRPFSATRIMTALMSGRLQRSRLYHEFHVPEFRFNAIDGPISVAHDGEVTGKYDHAEFRAHYRVLQVFRPR